MVDYASAWGDPLAKQAQGNDYVNKLFDQKANIQAGQQFAGGNYDAAATTLANRGDIAGATGLKNFAIQKFQAQHAMLQEAVPALQGILAKGGPQAVVQAFDTIAPQLTSAGATPDDLAKVRQGLATDPANTLAMLDATAKKNITWHDSNGTLIGTDDNGKLVGYVRGDKVMPIQNQIVSVPGASGGTLADPAFNGTGGGDGGVPPPPASSSPAGGLQPPAQGGSPAPAAGGSPPPGSKAGVNLANNNPGNIKKVGGNGFQTFPDMATGIMAVGHQLALYGSRGINTVQAIVSTYAPASDGNDTAAYIADVSRKLGVDPSQPLNLQDPNVLKALTDAIVTHEQGGVTPTQLLARGAQPAPGGPNAAPPTPQGSPAPLPQAAPPQQAAPAPAAGPGATNIPGAPVAPGGARVVYTAPPEFRLPTDAERQQYPGVAQMDMKGQAHYPPAGTMTGDAATIDYSAKRYLTGDLSAISNRGTAFRIAVVKRAAELSAAAGGTPEGDAMAINLRSANAAALKQNTTMGANVAQAENTALKNADLMLSLAPRGVGPTKLPIFDKWVQSGRRATGDKDIGAFDVAIRTFATEYGRVMAGGTGNQQLQDSARNEAIDLINSADNLETLKAKVATMRIDMANRKAGISDEHDALVTSLGGRPQASAPSGGGTKTVRIDINGKVLP